jgi:hypothetical protein
MSGRSASVFIADYRAESERGDFTFAFVNRAFSVSVAAFP